MDQKPYQIVLCGSLDVYCVNNPGEMEVLGGSELRGGDVMEGWKTRSERKVFSSLNLRGANILVGAITAVLGNTPIVVNGFNWGFVF